MALRWDYMVRTQQRKQLSFGGTVVRLSKRPLTSKVSYDNSGTGGTNEPIRNYHVWTGCEL